METLFHPAAALDDRFSWLRTLRRRLQAHKGAGLLARDAFTEIELRSTAMGGGMQGLHYLGRQSALSDCLFLLGQSACQDTSVIRAAPCTLLGFLRRRAALAYQHPVNVRLVVDQLWQTRQTPGAKLFVPYVRAIKDVTCHAAQLQLPEQYEVRIGTHYEDFDLYFEHLLLPSYRAGLSPMAEAPDKALLWRRLQKQARVFILFAAATPVGGCVLHVASKQAHTLCASTMALLRPEALSTAQRHADMRTCTAALQAYAQQHGFAHLDLGLTHNNPGDPDYRRKAALGVTFVPDGQAPRFAVL